MRANGEGSYKWDTPLATRRRRYVYARTGRIIALLTFPEVGSLAVRFRQPGLLSRGQRPQQRLGLKPLRGIFDANPKLWATYVSSQRKSMYLSRLT